VSPGYSCQAYIAGMNTPAESRMIRISLFMPTDLLKRLRQASATRRVPVAQLVRMAVEQSLGAHRPEPRGGFLREGREKREG